MAKHFGGCIQNTSHKYTVQKFGITIKVYKIKSIQMKVKTFKMMADDCFYMHVVILLS